MTRRLSTNRVRSRKGQSVVNGAPNGHDIEPVKAYAGYVCASCGVRVQQYLAKRDGTSQWERRHNPALDVL